MSMNKVSQAQQGQMMKMAAANLRALSEQNQSLNSENTGLKEKVAFYEKRERAEKIAHEMDSKGIEPELPVGEKIAALMKRDNLDVIEEAVKMSAPQMKLASVHDDSQVMVEGGTGTTAESNFLTNLLSMEE